MQEIMTFLPVAPSELLKVPIEKKEQLTIN